MPIQVNKASTKEQSHWGDVAGSVRAVAECTSSKGLSC